MSVAMVMSSRHVQAFPKTSEVYVMRRWRLNDLENWLNNEPTNNTNLLFEMFRIQNKYIEYTDSTYPIIIALWIIGTYLIAIWKSYPYLSISGNKRSGKSKLLNFLSSTSFNGVKASTTTRSSMFRTIENLQSTFLVDDTTQYTSGGRKEDILKAKRYV